MQWWSLFAVVLYSQVRSHAQGCQTVGNADGVTP